MPEAPSQEKFVTWLKTENMRPIKPSSMLWYMACVLTSTWDGSTVMCGWLWYL